MLLAHDQASGTASDISKLDGHFAMIRKLGYEEAESLQIQGIKNISFPVLDPSGHAFAAVTVPFLRRLDQENEQRIGETREALKKVALKLSATADTHGT
jgi:DNA-binding IclR family transcriptional regulator